MPKSRLQTAPTMLACPSAITAASSQSSGVRAHATEARRSCRSRSRAASRPAWSRSRRGRVPGDDLIEYSYEAKALAYLRLIPTVPKERPLPLSILQEAVFSAPSFGSQYGGLTVINRFGAIVYVPKTRPPKGRGVLSDSTQLFDNGEIWSVCASLIVAEADRGDRPVWVKLPMMHSFAFEDRFYRLIRSMTSFAVQNLELQPPFQVEAGLVGVDGAHIALPDPEFWTVRRADIVHRALINNVEHATLNSFLIDFFEKAYDATGYKRPKELNGFPSGPPRTRQSR
jgi:hypothetical protein